jgi:immunoglobulin-binding protein 1
MRRKDGEISSLAEGESRLMLDTDGNRQSSADAPTKSELLALEAENDGTMRGDEAAEEQRQKAEYWAQYGELNKKGAGNTTNRG